MRRTVSRIEPTGDPDAADDAQAINVTGGFAGDFLTLGIVEIMHGRKMGPAPAPLQVNPYPSGRSTSGKNNCSPPIR